MLHLFNVKKKNTRTVSGIMGWQAFFMGVFLFVFIMLMMGTFFPESDDDGGSSIIMQGVVVSVITFAVFLTVYGIIGIRNQYFLKRCLRKYPEEPWLGDFKWNPKGIKCEIGSHIYRLIFALIGSLLLMVFSLIAGFNEIPRGWILAAITGIFALAFLCRLLYSIMVFMKYGNSYIAFNSFPFFLGTAVDVTFYTKHPLTAITQLNCELRFVKEAEERPRENRRNDTPKIVRKIGYRETVSVYDIDLLQSKGTGIPISLPLPEGGHQNSELSYTPPQYWELEITGEAPGIDFNAVFLLPVYLTYQRWVERVERRKNIKRRRR